MNISFSTHEIFTGKHDGAVVFTYEERSDAEAQFAKKLGNNCVVARQRQEFRGKHKEIFLETRPDSLRFCALVGLGKKADVSPTRMREAAGEVARKLQEMGVKHLAIEVPQECDAQDAGQAITEGVLLSTYQYTRYRTKNREEIKELQSVMIVSDRTGVGVKHGVDMGKAIGEAVNMARDFQNTPSQDLTPPMFADAVAKIAKKEKLSCKILDRKQLEKQGYGGILAVGRGSANEPRLVTLEHNPRGAKRTLAFVGKGITFDTGGISLKPGQKMADMKFDMSGAASVVGIMVAVARLNVPLRVVGVLGLAENMPDGAAYKPGDVVKTKSGKTIEVDNTDAEGRVVLADALYHANTFKPEFMVNLATLTGAVIIALGDVAAGVMGNDQSVVEKIKSAADTSGEKVWQLPLWEEYERDIESKIADVRNVGLPRMAGTITAGMFLKEFVGETPWAHLDIAGVAWADPRDNYFTKNGCGGTGFGVRLLVELLRKEHS